MANINQVYEIVNSITEQALGVSGLQATDVSFVSNGELVLSNDKNTEAWYGVLVDRIGYTINSIRTYEPSTIGMRRTPFDYGMLLQKLNVKMPKATENTTWVAQDSEFNNPFVKTIMTVSQKLFGVMSVWDIDGTIPDVQLRTAFTSPEAMGAFIDGLMTAMYNAQEVQIENMDKLCRAVFIARKMAQGNACAVDLLAEYNATQTTPITRAVALKSVDFLRFAAMRISLASVYMRDMSVLFSDGDIERHTPYDLQCLDVLAEFSKTMSFYLQSDTYHDALVAMPKFNEVTAWQGVKSTENALNIDTVSAINIKYKTDSGEQTFNQNYIVGVLYDWEAIGTTINDRRTRSIYNPKDEYTNYFNKVEIGYFTDTSENGIVFYLGNDPVTANMHSAKVSSAKH